MKNKVFSGQSREIISNVLKFMQAEATAGQVIISLPKVQERFSAATGVSMRSIGRNKKKTKEVEEGNLEQYF